MVDDQELQFTTLRGLKRRAKWLKKVHGFSHNKALERVAQAGGYKNYHAAFKALEQGNTDA